MGVPAIATGAAFGIAVVALGWVMGGHDLDPTLAAAHYRLALGGFLGLTIVGVSFQFYPPAIGETPGVSDRTALASVVMLAGGVGVEAIGVTVDTPFVAQAGSAVAVAGSLVYGWVLYGLFWERQ